MVLEVEVGLVDDQQLGDFLVAILRGPEQRRAADLVDEQIDATTRVFMGMSVACARCHDHKYDSITQKDYYQVYAMFNNLAENGRAWKEGNSEPLIKAPTVPQRNELATLRERESRALKSWEEQENRIPAAMKDWEARDPALPVSWTVTDVLAFQMKRDDLALTKVEETDAGKLSVIIREMHQGHGSCMIWRQIEPSLMISQVRCQISSHRWLPNIKVGHVR